MKRFRAWSAAVLLASLATGCASHESGRGFDAVQSEVRRRTGAETRWDRGSREDAEAAAAWRALLARGLTVESAVQIALLNRRELVATYEDLDIAQADVVRAGLLRNPIFSGELRFDAEGGGTSIALGITAEFVSLLTMPLRTERAGAAFEIAKVRVTRAAVEAAYEAQVALQEYQAAEQVLELRESAAQAAEASHELARRLVDAGNIPRADQLAEAVTFESARLDIDEAREELAAARERVNVALGLWGGDTAWVAASRLPPLPAADDVDDIERRAVEASLEIAAARWSIEQAGASARLAQPLAWFDGGEVGAAAEREPESGWSVGPSLSLPIPIFDMGGAASGEAAAHLRQAEARSYAVAVEVRAVARTAVQRLLAARSRWERLRDMVLPLHERLVDETQRQYNAMQASAFELLRVKREEIEAGMSMIDAMRDYWNARATLARVLGGASLPHAGTVVESSFE